MDNNLNEQLLISTLGHTWFIDIDGTVAKHNGYKLDGKDTLLPGVKEFFAQIPDKDVIIFVTSRSRDYQEITEKFLNDNGLRYDSIIFELPFGERILINDSKPSGLVMSHTINLERDCGTNIEIKCDSKL